MNLPRFFLLLVATSFLRACADYGDNADTTVVTSMLRNPDPDQLLQLVALKESNRDDSIPTVRARLSKRWLLLECDELCLAQHWSSLRPFTPQAASIGSWETDESIDGDERDLAANCGSNRKYFDLDLRTDAYGFEQSWTLMRKQSNTWVKVASGPPSGTTYGDNSRYTGGELFSVAYNTIAGDSCWRAESDSNDSFHTY